MLSRAEKNALGYGSWANMMQRCYNPKKTSYDKYGGKGIKVHPNWSRFSQFLEDMGPKPYPTASLDRIDNDGGYTPENCKWSSCSEQNLNQNVRKDNQLGERGISYHNGRYRVILHRDGKFFRSAYTTTLESAVKIRDFFLEEYELENSYNL